MPEHVDRSLNSDLHQRRPGQICLGLLGVALLLFLTLGAAALNHLMPKGSYRAPEITARLGWYLHAGQFEADVRTLAAAFQFILETELSPPAVTNYANLPAAENAAPNQPES